jgi:hypothetical protein
MAVRGEGGHALEAARVGGERLTHGAATLGDGEQGRRGRGRGEVCQPRRPGVVEVEDVTGDPRGQQRVADLRGGAGGGLAQAAGTAGEPVQHRRGIGLAQSQSRMRRGTYSSPTTIPTIAPAMP